MTTPERKIAPQKQTLDSLVVLPHMLSSILALDLVATSSAEHMPMLLELSVRLTLAMRKRHLSCRYQPPPL